MIYPSPILKKDRKVLEIIGRGHPERMVTAHTRYRSGGVNAIEWEEIQIASALTFDELANCIAHLVANNMIESGTQLPGLLGRLTGKQEKHYFWITEKGRRFLHENPEETIPERLERPDRQNAKAHDIEDAIRIYEDGFSTNPYVKKDEIHWAENILDDDIKDEVRKAAIELEEMWQTFEHMFGRRGPVSSESQKAVRDPVVKRSTVRLLRAQDEQLRRRGFPPSAKPEAWNTHYQGGNVGLEPAPWER